VCNHRDFSRELYADIFPHKTQNSAARFLTEIVIAQCRYRIDYAYSDNGKEFEGTADYPFVKACKQHTIGQKFTRIDHPQTNSESELTLKTVAISILFINLYNTVKPHKDLNHATPL